MVERGSIKKKNNLAFTWTTMDKKRDGGSRGSQTLRLCEQGQMGDMGLNEETERKGI